MAKSKKVAKRRASPTLRQPGQLELGLSSGTSRAKTPSPNRIEVLVPSAPADVQPGPAPETDGAEENRYLLHQADKYEERALKALVFFLASACLTILAKSGVNVTAAMAEKWGIPPVANEHLLPGILASATILFAAALGYFALRIHQHSPQLKLKLVSRTWAGLVAQVVLRICALLIGLVLLAVVLVSWTDILFLFSYVIDRQFYILDGWDPVSR